MIPLNLVVEDRLSEAVARKIILQTGRPFSIGNRFIGRQGYGYIKSRIRGFNEAARHTPFFVLTDLDSGACAPLLINEWLGRPINGNLILRVAVHEVESWILAHREGLADFFGIRSNSIPINVDKLPRPKEALIDLARQSNRKNVRVDIVPPDGSSRVQGPDYNGRLAHFVEDHWDPTVAMRNSESLYRAINAVSSFHPTWAVNTL